MGVIYKNGIRYSGGNSGGAGDSIQYSVMPAASSILVNKIVQYIGDTTGSYVNGYFYKCVEDRTTTPSTYGWMVIEVQNVDAKQPVVLTSPITVDGTSKTTVETALDGINTLAASNKTNKQPKTLDTSLTIDGTSATTVEGALGTLNTNKQPKTLATSLTIDTQAVTTVEDALSTLNTKKLNSSLKGASNGLAELGSDGKVPSSQLPSYVDDVLEYASKTNFPATGETGKIYVALDTNKTYRWSGSEYVEISESLALGETSSTAYRGDYGAAAYAHAVTNKGVAAASGLYKITTNAEGHVTSVSAVTAADIEALGFSKTGTIPTDPSSTSGMNMWIETT